MKEVPLPEQPTSLIDDQKFMEKFREELAGRFEDFATDPEFRNHRIPLNIGEKIRKGEAIQMGSMEDGILCRLGQDYRLSPDEIDRLREKFFGKAKS